MRCGDLSGKEVQKRVDRCIADSFFCTVETNTVHVPGDVRDAGSIPGSGRVPGGGHGNPLQYSCLENPTDREPVGLQPIGPQGVGHD